VFRRPRTIGSVPVAAYPQAAGVPPVAVARLSRQNGAVAPAVGPHAHDFLVVLYAHRADGRLTVDGRTWTVTDGDVFVIAPGQVVSNVGPDHSGMNDAWVIFFRSEAVAEAPATGHTSWRTNPLLFPFARDPTAGTQRLRVPREERDTWAARCTALADELHSRRDGYRDAVLAHLTLLLIAVSRLSADLVGERRAVNEPVLAAVFDSIEARYREPMSLADVAAELGLSAGYLTTLVRRKSGRTVQQWITERRMQAARRLLNDTDLAIAEISRQIGYRDVSYFTRRFRSEHGMAPLQWRRAGRNVDRSP
jgi:AraC family transcriptional regulator, transcriptional activator of pobA